MSLCCHQCGKYLRGLRDFDAPIYWVSFVTWARTISTLECAICTSCFAGLKPEKSINAISWQTHAITAHGQPKVVNGCYSINTRDAFYGAAAVGHKKEMLFVSPWEVVAILGKVHHTFMSEDLQFLKLSEYMKKNGYSSPLLRKSRYDLIKEPA